MIVTVHGTDGSVRRYTNVTAFAGLTDNDGVRGRFIPPIERIKFTHYATPAELWGSVLGATPLHERPREIRTDVTLERGMYARLELSEDFYADAKWIEEGEPA
jgi:hypothetical protein